MKEQIERQKLRNAIIYLAQCIENGSWQNVTEQTLELLNDGSLPVTPASQDKE